MDTDAQTGCTLQKLKFSPSSDPYTQRITFALQRDNIAKVKAIVEDEIGKTKIHNIPERETKIVESTTTHEKNENERYPERFGVNGRTRRSYMNDEMDNRILTYMSTILYHFLNAKVFKRKIGELEILHIYTEKRTVSIIIAINNWTGKKNKDMVLANNMLNELQKNNGDNGKTLWENLMIGKNRDDILKLKKEQKKVKRYLNNFQRIISQEIKDSSTPSLVRFLKTSNVKISLLNVEDISSGLPGKNNIYLVHPVGNRRCAHAEQQLCDIVDQIRLKTSHWKFRIIGKKRHCMKCVTRLRKSEIDNYIPNFQLFYKKGVFNIDMEIKSLSQSCQKFRIVESLYPEDYALTGPSYIIVDSSDIISTKYTTDSQNEDNDECNSDNEENNEWSRLNIYVFFILTIAYNCIFLRFLRFQRMFFDIAKNGKFQRMFFDIAKNGRRKRDKHKHISRGWTVKLEYCSVFTAYICLIFMVDFPIRYFSLSLYFYYS